MGLVCLSAVTEILPLTRVASSGDGSVVQRASTASWLIVAGHGSTASLALAEVCPGPALFVVADDPHEQRLRQAWMGPWPDRWQVLIRLLGEQSQDCSWYSYNDPRRNGLASPEMMRHDFPNLRLVGVELREQITLAALVDDWLPAQSDGGMLVLKGDRAFSLLPSAGDRLNRLATLVLPGDEGHPQLQPQAVISELTCQLEACWLAPDGLVDDQWLGRAQMWKRDQHLRFQHTVLLERDGLRTEREVLQQQVAEQAQCLGVVESEREALTAEVDGLRTERDGLRTEREALQQQVAEQAQRFDLINRELDEILVLIDQVTPQMDEAVVEAKSADLCDESQ